MLLADPTARPTVAEVHATLMGLRSGTATVGRAPRLSNRGRAPVRLRPAAAVATPAPAAAPVAGTAPDPAAPCTASRPTALRGKGLRIVTDAVRPAPDAPPSRARPRTLGKLLDKLEERKR
jgi:hypothetical protein